MKKILLSTALVASVFAAGAYAHGGATGIVLERMEMMKDLGRSMKVIAQMMAGARDFDEVEAKKAAANLGAHGAASFERLFPEGSGGGVSEAADAIWADWDEFRKIADQLAEGGKGLYDGIGPAGVPEDAFLAVSGSCKACHRKYRISK